MPNIVAVICDCDETLAPDTTEYLLMTNGIKPKPFWRKIEKDIQEGWDPPMAWMTRILSLMKSGDIKQNTNQKLEKLGEKIKPFKGVPDFISQLQRILKKKKYSKVDIKLETYIISSGIEDLIKGTKFSKLFTDVYGSRFYEDKSLKKITSIKSIVTFTEKTKFLYAINKGISGKNLRSNPFLVNNRYKKDTRRIPFNNMIYLGDSTGDVPCFSAIKHFQGEGIGISTKNKISKGYKLAKERRSTVGPYFPEYSKGSNLRSNLDTMVERVANRILDENY